MFTQTRTINMRCSAHSSVRNVLFRVHLNSSAAYLCITISSLDQLCNHRLPASAIPTLLARIAAQVLQVLYFNGMM